MEKRPKTRWGCIIIPMIILLILGALVYVGFVFILPSFQKSEYESSKITPKLNEELEETFEDIKQYGAPVKESDPTGRIDPFAPF